MSVASLTGYLLPSNNPMVNGNLAVPSGSIQDNSGSVGTAGQVLAKAPTGSNMLWTSYTLFTQASPEINLTIPDGNDTTSGTAFTIPYGVDGDVVYRVGTYLITYTLAGYTAAGDGVTSVQTGLVAVPIDGANPIPYSTGNFNSAPTGFSITGSQVVTFTTAQYGNIEITITLNGEATNTLNVPQYDMTLTVIQIA